MYCAGQLAKHGVPLLLPPGYLKTNFGRQLPLHYDALRHSGLWTKPSKAQAIGWSCIGSDAKPNFSAYFEQHSAIYPSLK